MLATNKMVYDLPKIMQLGSSNEIERSDLLSIRLQDGVREEADVSSVYSRAFTVGEVQENTTQSMPH